MTATRNPDMPEHVEWIHITDTHLRDRPESTLHGWHVAPAFERVLAAARARHPALDGIVLGGDLVDDLSPGGYHWLNAQLRRVGLPVLAVAGNHDDPQRMGRILTAARVHDSLATCAWQLIGLNSHWPGHEAGRLTTTARRRLETALAAGAGPVLVVVHHPPFAVGSAWIDAMNLSDGARLLDTLAAHPRVRGLLCGHVHQAHCHTRAGLTAWTTPATMRQFLPGATGFAEDRQRGPGYRWLRLDSDGGVTTRVFRVDAAGLTEAGATA